MSRWTRVALLLAIVAAAFLVFSGPGTRSGWWPYTVGLELFALAAPVALAAVVVSAIAWWRERAAGEPVIGAICALVASLIVFAIPAMQINRARHAAPIHDVSTDFADPPRFSAVLPLRANSPNRVDHLDPMTIRFQRGAYPDIRPLLVRMPPPAAFGRALETATRLRWTIVATRPADGVIEATDTTSWFGFHDDVVVRVRSVHGGSRIDIRSASRVGRGDAGKNAQRIRRFFRAFIRGFHPTMERP